VHFDGGRLRPADHQISPGSDALSTGQPDQRLDAHAKDDFRQRWVVVDGHQENIGIGFGQPVKPEKPDVPACSYSGEIGAVQLRDFGPRPVILPLMNPCL
jgi:hypothetical protein